MPRNIVRTNDAPPAPPTYSQAVKAGGLVFVSGTGPLDPSTGKIGGSTIQEQTRQCLTNIAAILNAAGSSLDKIASATVILLEEEDFAGINEEWLKWFHQVHRHGREQSCSDRRGLILRCRDVRLKHNAIS
jgi:2-iminobutanoate/2-iminopropanoate deaminase